MTDEQYIAMHGDQEAAEAWLEGEREVEARANKRMLRTLTLAALMMIIVWVLNLAGIFIVDGTLMAVTVVVSDCILLAPLAVCAAVGLERPWVKYLLTACCCVAVTIACMLLSFHVVLALCLPILFAGQYRTKNVLVMACVLMLVGTWVGAVGGYYLGMADLNMLMLSRDFTQAYIDEIQSGQLALISVNSNPTLTITLYFVLPRCMILTLCAYIVWFVVEDRSKSAVSLHELQAATEMDKVTRFFNKAKFERMVKSYYPSIDTVGVIFWDINNLKVVNDSFGHKYGDWLIALLTNAIFKQLDNNRRVYRVGGDEFIMVIEDPEPNEAEDVIAAVNQAIIENNTTSKIKLSCASGSATGPGTQIARVVDDADAAMYLDKNMLARSSANKLARSQDLLEDPLFEGIASVSDNIYTFICDLSTNMWRISTSARDYFGMESDYIENMLPVWFDRVHPDDLPAYRASIEPIVNGTATKHHHEYRARNANDEYVWLECRGNVIEDSQRFSRYFVGVMMRLDGCNKYDPLTKMETIYEFNNIDFTERTGALLLIGLDDFRKIVNTYGYAYGDTVLSDFATRLMRFSEGRYRAFRLEGDEFLVLIPGGTHDSAVEVFRSMKSLLIGLGEEGGRVVNLQFSGGAVLYPQDGCERSELLGNVERSFDWAKQIDRTGLVFYDQAIARMRQRSLRLKNELNEAMANNFTGFSMRYQPIVSADTGHVASCEALLRFESSSIDDLGIGEVVEQLEQTGHIVAVGRWIIEAVFAQAAAWQQRFPNMTVGVNVSMMQFRDPGCVDFILDAAKRHGVNTSLITIELTESAEVTDIYAMQEYLQQLHNAGFRIALDDFGIGYSTLLIIKSLPADAVKIDQNFVRSLDADSDPTDLAIIESVLMLCRSLGIKTVAEGVENENVIKVLQRYSIDLYQGYHFSEPLDVADFEEYVENNL